MLVRLILALAAPLAMAMQDVPRPPRAGILCELALDSWFEQVAARCKPAAPAEVRAAYHDGVMRIDAYVRARSKASEADIAAFLHDQGGGKLSDSELCDEDFARQMRVSFAGARPEDIRAETDKAIAGEREIKMDPCL